MSRLARVPLSIVALACAAWATFVVFLPRLTAAASLLAFRLFEGTNVGVAFKTEWTSRRAMVIAALVPPTLFLCAWATSRARR